MLKVLIYSIVFISLCEYASSIDCWLCTSADSGCGENIIEATLQDNLKTASGCAACGKTFKSLGTVWYEVTRTCLTTATDTCDNKLGYGVCTCTSTFCNGQSKLALKPVFILFFSICIIVLFI